MTHGTAYSVRKGCRCDECRTKMRDYQRLYRAGVRPGGTPKGQQTHGLNGYQRHKCRCEVCRAANAAAQRRWRRKRVSNTGTERDSA